MLFYLLFVVSLIQGTSFLIQLTKISVMAITFVVIAVSVRSPDDFLAGALGLASCAGALVIRGYFRGLGNFSSINPIEGSQKNAFSLFYLPALTLCLYLVFSDELSAQRRAFLALVITLIFSGIALSKNRSGWLSAGVLLFLVFGTNRQRIRILAVLVMLAGVSYIIADIVTAETDVVYERDITNEQQSDNLRIQLIMRALSIGFQHPLLGVSPSRLIRMLGTIAKVDEEGIDCHNLTGYLIGGSGLLTFGAFCLFAFAMLFPPRGFHPPQAPPWLAKACACLLLLPLYGWCAAQFQEDVRFSLPPSHWLRPLRWFVHLHRDIRSIQPDFRNHYVVSRVFVKLCRTVLTQLFRSVTPIGKLDEQPPPPCSAPMSARIYQFAADECNALRNLDGGRHWAACGCSRRSFPGATIAMSDHGPDKSFFNTYQTSCTAEDVISLPKMVSLPHGLLKRRACRATLRPVVERSDILLVQLPFDSPFALINLNRPRYHLPPI